MSAQSNTLARGVLPQAISAGVYSPARSRTWVSGVSAQVSAHHRSVSVPALSAGPLDRFSAPSISIDWLSVPVALTLHGGIDMETNTKRRMSAPHSLTTAANTPKPQPAPPVGALLTPQQLAEKLAVPASWVREKTRERARVRDSDPLPVVRLGKYVRFNWTDVEQWLARQGS